MPVRLPRHAPLALLLLVALAAPVRAQEIRPGGFADTVLTDRLARLLDGFGGVAGVYVRHLPTGATAEVHADTLFPTASLIKVPILATLFDQTARGLHDLDAVLTYPEALHYKYVETTDVAGYMVPGDTLPLSELVFLMLSVSDNVASLWIQGLVGGAEVNAWLDAHGFVHTRLNARTPGREASGAIYGWGQTTPREMADLFVRIREGRAVNPQADEQMYRLLTKSYWQGAALSQIPPTVQAASKQGFVDRSRSEVLLVNAPSGDYVLAVITKNQRDTSYALTSEGYRLIRQVSRAVYEHFNPDDPWRPVE